MKQLKPLAHLRVELPSNRDYTGILSAFAQDGNLIAGPFPVAGRAGDELAAEHGNPSRTTTLPYGDTPLGGYRIIAVSPTGPGTRYRRDLFGAHGAVVLQPRDGEAALAEANGRFEIIIHGGPSLPDGRLRATSGNLRIANEHLRILVELLQSSKLTACVCKIVAAKRRGKSIELAGADDPGLEKSFELRGTVKPKRIRVTPDLVAFGEYSPDVPFVEHIEPPEPWPTLP